MLSWCVFFVVVFVVMAVDAVLMSSSPVLSPLPHRRHRLQTLLEPKLHRGRGRGRGHGAGRGRRCCRDRGLCTIRGRARSRGRRRRRHAVLVVVLFAVVLVVAMVVAVVVPSSPVLSVPISSSSHVYTPRTKASSWSW